VGSDRQRLIEHAGKILGGTARKGKLPALWDGRAAERIVQTVAGGVQ